MKISIQSSWTTTQHGLKKTYELYRQVGFEAIDWNIDVALLDNVIKSGEYREKSVFAKSMEDIRAYFAEELSEIRRNGLEITQAHAPFPAYLPNDPELLDFMIEVYKKCILFCDEVGCKNLVIHGICYAKSDRDHTLEDIDAMNWKMYTSLIPVLKKTNVTVCMENLFTFHENLRGKIVYAGHCSNPHEAIAWIDGLNEVAGKECFGLCLDTGHLHLVKQDERVYIPILGKRIKALHIHDNDGVGDRHIAPYNGSIIWKDFYESLAAIGYEGDLNFETLHQTNQLMIPDELLLEELKTIYQTGVFFREKILQK